MSRHFLRPGVVPTLGNFSRSGAGKTNLLAGRSASSYLATPAA